MIAWPACTLDSAREVGFDSPTNEETMEPTYRYKAKILRVVDGDTLDVEFDLGMYTKRTERVRLFGINTPETYGVKKESQEYILGTAAKNFVTEQCTKAAEVVMDTKKDKKGKYGRYLATVWLYTIDEEHDEDTLQWINLNDWLVEAGHAERKNY